MNRFDGLNNGSKIGRRCMFCGGAAGSAEHVFPDWLNAVFPASDIGETTVTLDSKGPGDFADHRNYTKREAASLTSKEVCHACNTGWMWRLEVRVQSLITPMLIGQRVQMAEGQLVVLATWATKTVMALETCSGIDNDFSQLDREFLRRNDFPPDGVSVRSAQYEGNEGPFTYLWARLRRPDGITGVGIHTLHIGTMVLQVCLYDPPSSNLLTFGSTPEVSKYDVPVYPPTAQWQWPRQGTTTLNDELLDGYALRPWELGLIR